MQFLAGLCMQKKNIVLTGDRPTGPLHLGHYVGSLQNRLEFQNLYTQYVMIADAQALTDNYEHPEKVRQHVVEVMYDYLAIGLDPDKTTFFIQSMIPQIHELALYYLNLVTVNRLKRNPTVKAEIQQKGFGSSIPVGFFVYPIHQAADITVVKANLIPVGEDQLPMIEQTNEIVRSFNRIYKREVLVKCDAIIPKISRLPGIDGKAKMSKTLGNAIFLSDSSDVLKKKVMNMYTDPDHILASDPGKVEGNPVFTYLDVFSPDRVKVEEMKAHYRRGGLGDVKVKSYLFEVLDAFLTPIRTRRREFEQNQQKVMNILRDGTQKTLHVAMQTLKEVKDAMHLNYF